MDSKRLARQVFEQRMADARRRRVVNTEMTINTNKGPRALKHPERQYGFCNMVYDTLQHYSLQQYLDTTTKILKPQWKNIITKAIQLKEEHELAAVLLKDSLDTDKHKASPAAKWILKMNENKKNLSMEPYLSVGVSNKWNDSNGEQQTSHTAKSVRGRILRTQMRTYSAPLAAILHRCGRRNHTQLPPSPLCIMCDQKVDETPLHLLCVCPAYTAERTSLFHRVEQEFTTASISPSAVNQHLLSPQQRATQFLTWNEKEEIDKAQWLLCYDKNKEMVVAVNNFLVSAFSKRTEEIKRLVALAKRSNTNNTSGNITNAERDQQVRASRLFGTTTNITDQVDFTTSRLIKQKRKNTNSNSGSTPSGNGDADDGNNDDE